MPAANLQFEMERRVILFSKNTTLPDLNLLGYDGNPNNADPDNSDGEFLIFNCPMGTWFQQSNGDLWYKQQSPNQWTITASGTVDNAARLSLTKELAEDIEQYRMVSLTDANSVVKADKDTLPEVDGILIEAGLTGEERLLITYGIVFNGGFDYPVRKKLYLGNDGTITDDFPTSGNLTVIGRGLGLGAIFVDIQPTEEL